MLGCLSVVRVIHSHPDPLIARSSKHCKTDSLKSAVSERTHTHTHTRMSKWTTANYVIPCQLERDLGNTHLRREFALTAAYLHTIVVWKQAYTLS